MPLFDYICDNCQHNQEHFIYPSGSLEKKCPKCGSDAYIRQLPTFRTEVEYSDPKENYNKKILPGINSTYQQIGKEALNNDTKTLDNIFGTEKVKKTYGE